MFLFHYLQSEDNLALFGFALKCFDAGVVQIWSHMMFGIAQLMG